jgi:hypothetical protein
MNIETIEARITTLERKIGRANAFAAVTFVLGAGIGVIGTSLAKVEPPVIPEIRTHKLAVLDSQGRVRVEIGEDQSDTQRISRAAALTVFDTEGHERGGIGTLADGSAVMALDAPHGVGNAMRDRAGMKVYPDGTAFIATISNGGTFAAGLFTDGEAGRLELSGRGESDGTIATRTITRDADSSKVAQSD